MRFVCAVDSRVSNWLNIVDHENLGDNLEGLDEKVLILQSGAQLNFDGLSGGLYGFMADLISRIPRTLSAPKSGPDLDGNIGLPPNGESINDFVRRIRGELKSRLRAEFDGGESPDRLFSDTVGRICLYARNIEIFDPWAAKHLVRGDSDFFSRILDSSPANIKIWTNSALPPLAKFRNLDFGSRIDAIEVATTKLLRGDRFDDRKFEILVNDETPHNRRIRFEYDFGTINLQLDSGLDTFQGWRGRSAIRESTVINPASAGHVDSNQKDWLKMLKGSEKILGWLNGDLVT
jgi:hypothetical protein